jgi:hypothetical protein
MTRVERQIEFSEKFREWLADNVGPLTIGEVVGIMQVHIFTMTMDCHLGKGSDDENDDDGDNWKKGDR